MRMIDADALKKEWKMGDVCETCDQDTRECANSYCFSRMDVCGMIDDTPTVNGWISVNDRLPDAAGYECLVCAVNENYNQTHVFTAHTGYGEPGWWTSNVHYMSRVTSPSDNRLHPALNVTHWMPLPEPPEVKQDD